MPKKHRRSPRSSRPVRFETLEERRLLTLAPDMFFSQTLEPSPLSYSSANSAQQSEAEGESEALMELSYEFVSMSDQSLDPNPNDGVPEYRAAVGDLVRLQVYARDRRSQPQGVFATGQSIRLNHQDGQAAEILGLAYSEVIDLAITDTPTNVGATYRIQFGVGEEAIVTNPIEHPRNDGVINAMDRLRLANSINLALKNRLPAFGSSGLHGDEVTYLGRSGGYYRFRIFFTSIPGFRANIPDVTIVDNNIVSSTGSQSVIATSLDPNPQVRDSVRTSLWERGEYLVQTSTITNWSPIETGMRLTEVGSFAKSISNPPNPGGRTLQYEVLFRVLREETVFVSGEFASPSNLPMLLLGIESAIASSQIIFPNNIPFYALAAGSDRFEMNNSRTTATGLGTLQGQAEYSGLSIHQASDEDWFQFTTVAVGTAPHFVAATFNHAGGDLDLELYNQSGTKLASSNSASNEERISLQGLPAGTYFARVLGFNGATNTDYRLVLQTPTTVINADRFEANNTVATATNLGTLTTPQTTSGLTIHTTADLDHYRFQTSAIGRADDFVQINFSHAAGDLELRLLNTSGLVLASSKTANDFERISLNGRPAGQYIVQVLGENSARSPDYSLTIDPPAVSIPADSFETNNSLAAAKPLNLTQAYTEFPQLTIHQSTDQDWYSFQLSEEGKAGHFVAIDFEHRDGDIDLQLTNASGVVLRSSATAQNQERISLAGIAPGTYFVRVYGVQNATQPNYRLSLSVPVTTIDPDAKESNDTRITATDLRRISGDLLVEQLNIHQSADVDWFRFETAAVGTSSHFVGLIYRSGGADINLELYDQNGGLLARSSLNDNWEIINFANRPAGTYFARVYSANGGINADYSLGFSLPRASFSADRFEVNNTLLTATDLKKISEATSFRSLSIHQSSDIDWYRFETVAAGSDRHFIEMRSATDLGNLEIELYDSQGVLLERTNGWDSVERLSLRGRPMGVYFVRVLGINGALSDYELTLQVPTIAIPADIYESNNQREQAFDLRGVEGRRRLDNGTLHQAGDQDWFRFELMANATTSHYVLADFRHALGDVELELYDSQGRLIRTSTSSLAPESISLAGLTTGVYFIRLFGYQNATSPNYSLEIVAPLSGNLTPDRYESNNSLETATVIRSSGDLLVGSLDVEDLNLHSAADQDFYRFTTQATATAAHSISLDFNPGDGDLNLNLLDAQGNILRQSTRTSETENISLAGLAAGTYYIQVFGHQNATNDYRLRFDTPETSGTKDAWTILVYMTASDLETFAFEDINELEVAARALPGNVNLAVLWDQSAQRTRYSTSHGAQAAWGTVGRGFIQADSNRQSVATHFEILPEQNTGDPAVLTSFVNWAVAAAPADNYAMIAWDHGAGIFGSNYDNADNAPVDNLKISEFIAALSAPGIPEFQILSFDACLMAMTEIAYATRNIGEILVTSQEVVGAKGYDYTTLFSSLVRNPRATAVELAAGMVNSYQNSYASDTNGWNTQSAISLGSVSQLASSLASFTAAATSLTTSQWASLADNFNAAIGYATPDFRDLGSAMKGIAANSSLPTLLRTAASQVIQDLNSTIISLAADSRNSSGLSIFAPESTREISYFDAEFSEFASITGWSRFLNDLVLNGAGTGGGGGRFGRSVSSRDWGESNDRSANATNLFQVSGPGVAYANLSLHDSSDVDWFRFSIASTANSSHQIAVLNTGSSDVKIELYDAAGLVRLRESGVAANPKLSLSGLAMGEYTLRVASPVAASVEAYSIVFDAPEAPPVDRTGANNSQTRAFPLGLVSERLSVAGLNVAAQAEEWFSFSTPKLPSARWYSIEIPLGAGVSAEAVLRDQAGNVVSRASGSGELLLSYQAAGNGDSYFLQIVSQSTQAVPFSIRIASLTATFADVAIAENLRGVVVDRLPLTELVQAVGNVQISDPRFVWQDNQLLVRSESHFKRDEQRVTQLRIQVSDAAQPGRIASFILPITILSNPNPWHNSVEPRNTNLDRDSDGAQIINAIDALVVINYINRNGVGELPATRNAAPGRTEFLYDVNDDGFINAMDALLVINFLRRRGSGGDAAGEGEGEGEGESSNAAMVGRSQGQEAEESTSALTSYSEFTDLGLIDLLAEAHHRRRRGVVRA